MTTGRLTVARCTPHPTDLAPGAGHPGAPPIHWGRLTPMVRAPSSVHHHQPQPAQRGGHAQRQLRQYRARWPWPHNLTRGTAPT